MQTVRAIALIERAVELADARFPGDALEEACRFASREERLAVSCIVQSRPALFGHRATPQQVIAALREMVRGGPVRLLASA
ncbi:hypothetical protein [Azohydromonas australica]|uniref:hypothetical protein n=1 Tax=Azohydromonas australica TaxID=364039 RepID=UPI0004294E62|nr:hypothetical protein [Azohydromonas australica]